MKKILTLIAALAFAFAAVAQNAPQGPQNRPAKPGHKEMQERLQAEKIAFLTAELSLTPEEAQVFWPVYNKAQEDIRTGNAALRESQKALRDALQEGKDAKEIEPLLNAYLKARKDKPDVMAQRAPDFKKVIGPVKTAKLYLAEEKFRQQQIHRLSGHHPQKPGHQGRPGGQRPQPRQQQ